MKIPTDQPANPPEIVQLNMFVPHLLRLSAEGVQRQVVDPQLASFDLSFSEWQLLVVVGNSGMLSPSELSRQVGMDKVKVTRTTQNLAQRGVIIQTRNRLDGRARVIRLSAKGRRLFLGMPSTARQIETILAACMTATEWRGLQAALGKVVRFTQSLAQGEVKNAV